MLKVDILIRGCTVLPMVGRSFLQNGLVAIEGGKIVFVGRCSSAPHFVPETLIDARGMIAIPGLINCHTHLSMTLFRGVAEDRPLDVWLKETIWPLESRLKPQDIYDGAMLGCLEMIKGGTTCFADMYFHEGRVARAVQETGMRAVLAEGIIGIGKQLLGKISLRRSVAFARRFKGSADGRVNVMLGPHSVYSCGKNLLEKVRGEATRLGVGVHIHLAESTDVLKKTAKLTDGEVRLLEDMGFLGSHVLAAHCVDLSVEDRSTLSKRGVKVAYIPVANMKLGLAAARIRDMLDLGVHVGYGTDGPASNNGLDMFETMKVGVLLQKHLYRDPTVFSAYEALRMATIGGAETLGLGNEVGSLEVGKKADVVLVDFSKPHLKPLHDIYASIVYSAHGSDVDTVIVDGKILMQNRQVGTVDEQVIMERAERTASHLLSR